MILIAGPYRSGTGDDPEKLSANVRLMEAYALPLFRAGHIPILGEWLALPLAQLAGTQQIGDAAFTQGSVIQRFARNFTIPVLVLR